MEGRRRHGAVGRGSLPLAGRAAPTRGPTLPPRTKLTRHTQDTSYRIFTEGVISDDTGAVILNLMQQDEVIMRATFRVDFQVANPISREAPEAATRFPFAVLLESGLSAWSLPLAGLSRRPRPFSL